MKHLKRIYEIDQWATSNRIGGDYDFNKYDKIQNFIKKYNALCGEFEDESEYEDEDDLFDDFLEDVESLLKKDDLLNREDLNRIINSSGIRDKEALRVILDFM